MLAQVGAPPRDRALELVSQHLHARVRSTPAAGADPRQQRRGAQVAAGEGEQRCCDELLQPADASAAGSGAAVGVGPLQVRVQQQGGQHSPAGDRAEAAQGAQDAELVERRTAPRWNRAARKPPPDRHRALPCLGRRADGP
ncbi:hypothetical protein BJF80_10050 [Serinicoccus sp. CUA-874]|nr:hypothetical protein BJF80_10050 [Serinicoccus sp. CUA-874]